AREDGGVTNPLTALPRFRTAEGGAERAAVEAGAGTRPQGPDQDALAQAAAAPALPQSEVAWTQPFPSDARRAPPRAAGRSRGLTSSPAAAPASMPSGPCSCRTSQELYQSRSVGGYAGSLQGGKVFGGLLPDLHLGSGRLARGQEQRRQQRDA